MIRQNRGMKRDRTSAVPRTKPAEERRDDLMDAAARLFIAQGVEATTVDDIVAAAGVAKGTYYHYFPAKTDVVLALRDRFTAGFLSRIAAALAAAPAEPAEARLTAWIRAAVATYLDNVALHDVVFHDFRHDNRRSREKDAVLDQLQALLTAGQDAGSWRLGDARATAIVLFEGMHGVVDDAIARAAAERRPVDRAAIAETLAGLFLPMLGQPGAGRPRP